MKIAAIQLVARQGARAMTLQRALRALDAAARTDPAPDLVLLPAFGDTTATGPEADLVCEHVHGQTQAALGRAAREWGLYVAYGMLERSPAAALPYLSAILLDADGDVRLSHRCRVVTDLTRDRIQAGDACRTAPTIFGQIGLLAGDELLSEACWHDTAASAGLILGVACWGAWSAGGNADETRSGLAAQATRVQRPAAIADLSMESPDGTPLGQGFCAVFDGRGRACAAAVDSRGIAWADIEIPDLAKADGEAARRPTD